jgi:hypothetical protein
MKLNKLCYSFRKGLTIYIRCSVHLKKARTMILCLQLKNGHVLPVLRILVNFKESSDNLSHGQFFLAVSWIPKKLEVMAI